MHIRNATVADAAEIARIHVEAWRSAYRDIIPKRYLADLSVENREKRWANALAESTAGTRVAVDENGVVVGWTDFGPSRDADGEGLGELYAIYLDPSHWGLGIGRGLLNDAVEKLRDRDYPAITLWVLEDNARTRRFYEKSGFNLDGKTKSVTIEGKKLVEIRYRLDFK
jgi:ribosomal protein S18 acetylase RimI-like enzyme